MSTAHNTFPIHQHLAPKQPTSIRRPRQITCFSFDDTHKYQPDASSLRYYYPPVLPVDLNAGFSTFQHLDDSKDEHLDGLLMALIAHERKNMKKLETDIVTWRGMMTKLMVAPFSQFDDWEMKATYFDGTIYIEENHAKKVEAREQQSTGPAQRGGMSQDLMSYWGYKFEAISLLRQHWCYTTRAELEAREKEVVSNYAQYCSVVRTGFGKTKIIIGGEVDAVMDVLPDEAGQPVNWIELKTTAEVTSEKDEVKLERKLLKFWAQSFLLGVPKIIVGFRDQQGWLRRLEELDVQAIPDKAAKRGNRLWDGQRCIDFVSEFLEWMKQIVVGDGVWVIRKRERAAHLEVLRVEETGTGDILSPNFLDWRRDGFPRLQATSTEASAMNGPENIVCG